MKKTKVYTHLLFNLLKKPEQTALGKFLKSPFFTAKRFLYPLFLELRSSGEASTVKKPESIYARVFPGSDFDKHKWLKALSDLNACIGEFIAVQAMMQNPILHRQALVTGFSGRENEALFRRSVRDLLRILPGNDVPEDADGWYTRYWSLKKEVSYPASGKIGSRAGTLDEMEESLDLHYYISKLLIACNRASMMQLMQMDDASNQFRQLLEQTEGLAGSGKSALLILLRELLRLLINPEASFPAYFTLLHTYGPRVNRVEMESIVRLANGYCAYRRRRGEKEAFDWQKALLDWADTLNIWSDTTAEETFLNKGAMVAKSGDAGQLTEFVEKRKNALPAERRNDAVALIQAFRCFHTADYDATLAHLITINTRHPRYVLLMHSLKVRTQYELYRAGRGQPDAVEQSLEYFKDFLQRSDFFAQSFRRSYRTFIWFIKKLIQAGLKQRVTPAYLRQELKNRQPALREWIEAKIDGLPD